MQTIIKNNYYEVLTEEGYKDFDCLLKTHDMNTVEICINNDTLVCTPNHQIKKDGIFINADSLPNTPSINQDVFDLINVKDTHHYLTNNITSHNCILLDETAFIANWETFSASVLPTISSGQDTKLVMVSTPNGLNHFHEIWENAIRGINDYKPILVRWDEVPGRDEEWRRATLATLNFDEQKFDQEYCVTGDMKVTIKDTLTNQIFDIPIEELYNRLNS